VIRQDDMTRYKAISLVVLQLRKFITKSLG